MYLGRHESRYWPYWWRLSAFSWYLSVTPGQSCLLNAPCSFRVPAGLTTGTCSRPCGPLWACRMLGMSEVSEATSLPRAADVANARAVAEDGRCRNVWAADRSGRAMERVEAMDGVQWQKCRGLLPSKLSCVKTSQTSSSNAKPAGAGPPVRSSHGQQRRGVHLLPSRCCITFPSASFPHHLPSRLSDTKKHSLWTHLPACSDPPWLPQRRSSPRCAIASPPPTFPTRLPFTTSVMSKSQQDQFIDDDEEETCPLCVEEFDLTDKGFRPCPCGYQVRHTLHYHTLRTSSTESRASRYVSSATTMSRIT